MNLSKISAEDWASFLEIDVEVIYEVSEDYIVLDIQEECYPVVVRSYNNKVQLLNQYNIPYYKKRLKKFLNAKYPKYQSYITSIRSYIKRKRKIS